MIELTEHEAECIKKFIEINLVPNLRDNDLDIDSLWWIETILKVWRKCGGKYADEEADNGGAD